MIIGAIITAAVLVISGVGLEKGIHEMKIEHKEVICETVPKPVTDCTFRFWLDKCKEK